MGVECVVDAETYRSLNIAVFREDEVLEEKQRKRAQMKQSLVLLAGGSLGLT